MRLDELAGPVEGDVVGEILTEAGPLDPYAGERRLEDWMDVVADRVMELNPVDRARARPRVMAALEESVEWLTEVQWEWSMWPPGFRLTVVPGDELPLVAPRKRRI